MNLLEDRRFYVYVYLDPRKPGKYKYGEYEFNYEPFYVGKGSNNRDFVHLKLAKSTTIHNYFCCNKIKSLLKENYEPIIKRVQERLTAKQSYELEFLLTKTIGRININTGPLTNLAEGGEGPINKIVSEETREKIRKAHIGIKNSEATKAAISKANKGRKRSQEAIEKSRKAAIGRRHTEEYKQRMHNLMIGKKLSEETKIKIGIKSRQKTVDGRQRISEANSRRLAISGVHDNFRFAWLNRKHIDRTINKMSETAKLRKKYVILNNITQKKQNLYDLKTWCKNNNIEYEPFFNSLNTKTLFCKYSLFTFRYYKENYEYSISI